MNVRLPKDLGERFDRLCAEVSLPKAVILRLLLSETLNRPLEEQVEILLRQIRNPQEAPKTTPQTRIPGLNTGKRRSGR